MEVQLTIIDSKAITRVKTFGFQFDKQLAI